MDADALVAIVVALGGLGGVAGIITAISNAISQHKKDKEISVKDQIQSALAPLHTDIKEIKEQNAKQNREIAEVRLDTTRTQLYMKIGNEPQNHDTIFMIAHRYFVELGGDWCATIDFQAWADQEGIKIPEAIMDAIARNGHQK